MKGEREKKNHPKINLLKKKIEFDFIVSLGQRIDAKEYSSYKLCVCVYVA